MAQEDSTFEDTVKNLLKMPHKPAKAEKDDQDDELAAESINRQKTVSTYGAYAGCVDLPPFDRTVRRFSLRL